MPVCGTISICSYNHSVRACCWSAKTEVELRNTNRTHEADFLSSSATCQCRKLLCALSVVF